MSSAWHPLNEWKPTAWVASVLLFGLERFGAHQQHEKIVGVREPISPWSRCRVARKSYRHLWIWVSDQSSILRAGSKSDWHTAGACIIHAHWSWVSRERLEFKVHNELSNRKVRKSQPVGWLSWVILNFRAGVHMILPSGDIYAGGTDSGVLEIKKFLHQPISLLSILFTRYFFAAFALIRENCKIANKTTTWIRILWS